jgi:flagellar basal body-associated protein FliL
MSETKVNEKKVVGRNVVIVLGIVCIILVAGIGGVMAYYMRTVTDKNITYDSLQSAYNDYVANHHYTDSEHFSLQSTYNDYVSSHHNTNSEYDSLQAQNTNLQNEVDDLDAIVHIAKSSTWTNSEIINQPANSYWSFSIRPSSTNQVTYAGYVAVQVHSSTTDKTYVRVIYSTYVITSITDGHASVTALDYDNQISVGASGTAVFPVIPISILEIRIGNTDPINGATETVTIRYYY